MPDVLCMMRTCACLYMLRALGAERETTGTERASSCNMTEPEDNREYKNVEYWDKRYTSEESYDWFFTWPELREKLSPHITHQDRILHLGCGNSTVSADMFDDGYTNLVNVDFSEVVIHNMAEKRPDMSWIRMDIRDMPLEGGSFDVVLDKGTLDALEVDSSEESVKDLERTLHEVYRVLRPGGKYIQISFCHPIRRPYLIADPLDWTLERETIEGHFHYHMCVLTKPAS